MNNPWSLLDPRDLHGPPRSERERILDYVLDNLRTLATLSETPCATGDTMFDGLVGDGDINEAITLVMRIRQASSTP